MKNMTPQIHQEYYILGQTYTEEWTHSPAQTAAMEVDAKWSSFLSSLTAGAERVTHGLWASVCDRAKFKFWKKSEHPAMAQISLGIWTWMPFSNPSWLSRATLALWSWSVCSGGCHETSKHEIIAKKRETEIPRNAKLFITVLSTNTSTLRFLPIRLKAGSPLNHVILPLWHHFEGNTFACKESVCVCVYNGWPSQQL